MRLDYNAIIKEFRARCGRADIQLTLEEGLQVPYATQPRSGLGAQIVLPHPSNDWSQDEWDYWLFQAEHEVGHLLPHAVDAYDVLHEKNIDTGSFIGMTMNCLEDHRQEHTNYHEYAGRRVRLSRGRRMFWDKLDMKNLFNPAADDKRHALETLIVWDNTIREDWMRSLVGTSAPLVNAMLPKQKAWYDKLCAGDYESTLKSGITAAQEYELVKRIITEVFGIDAEQEEQDAQRGKGKDGEGESGEDEKVPAGHGDGDPADGESSSGEATEGDGDAEEGNGSGGDGEKTKAGISKESREVDYSDLLAHNHGKDAEGASYSSLKINYDSGTENFTPCDPKDYKLIDYEDGGPLRPNKKYRDLMDSQTGVGLAKHVRRLLQVRSQSTYQHGLKRGKISPKSIYRGGLNGSAQQKVFKKRIDSDVLDCAVSILVDMSGSMGGNPVYGRDKIKVVNAAISAKLLNDAIAAIGVPLEICGFDDSAWRPRHAIIKSFAKSATCEQIFDRFADATNRMMSGNSDGESILWMHDRLTKRKEKRKVLIVLSDGQPAGGNGDAMYYTQQVVKEIEEKSPVDVIGIGLEDDTVKRIYKNYACIKDSSELEAGLLKIIENKILN